MGSPAYPGAQGRRPRQTRGARCLHRAPRPSHHRASTSHFHKSFNLPTDAKLFDAVVASYDVGYGAVEVGGQIRIGPIGSAHVSSVRGLMDAQAAAHGFVDIDHTVEIVGSCVECSAGC